MLYKLVIVDDEHLIREGLVKYIDWKQMGFEVSACLEDGQDAIDYLNSNPVDVILSDIKMINVSGLELAEYVYKNKPEIKMIIISGYKEFEFAKKAINFGVLNYVLKPTKFNEITGIFTDVKTKLDIERENQKKIEEKVKQNDEMASLLKLQFFTDLVMGALRDPKDIQSRLKFIPCSIDMMNSRYYLYTTKLMDYDKYNEQKWNYGKSRLNIALQNILQSEDKVAGFYPIINSKENFKVLAVVSKSIPENDAELLVKKHFDDIIEHLRVVFELEMDIQFNLKFDSIYILAEYNEPLDFVDKCKLTTGRIIDGIVNNERLTDQKKLFLSYLTSGDATLVYSLLDSMIDEIARMPMEYINEFLIDLFLDAFNNLSFIIPGLKKMKQERFHYHAIIKLDTLESSKQWAVNLMGDILKLLETVNEDSSMKLIKKAIHFINENYQKDISLEDAASEVFLSPVYFCRFFKKETGENFSDYLIRVRMKKAMELLRNSKYKVYEVGVLVGYKDSKYFSKIFKKYTGYSPITCQKMEEQESGDSK